MQPEPEEPSAHRAPLVAIWFAPLLMRIADLVALALGGASLSGGWRSGLPEAIVNWDGHWYLGIAVSGYSYVPGTDSNVAFFPAFPLAMRCVGEAASIGYPWAGVAISMAASLAITPLAYALVSAKYGAVIGRRAAVTLALFPTSFFFVLPYPDAAFVAAVLAAFLLASANRWFLAALAGAVASALKIFGIFLAPAFLWMALDRADWKLGNMAKPAPLSAAAASVTSLGGVLAYCAYLWIRFANPVAFYSAQMEGWPHRRTAVPLPVIHTAGEVLRPTSYLRGERPDLYWAYLLDLAVVLAVVAVLFAVASNLEGSWLLWWVAAASLPLLSGTTNSFARYALSFFPFFAGIGLLLARRWIRVAVWALLGSSQLAFAYLFGRGWWVG